MTKPPTMREMAKRLAKEEADAEETRERRSQRTGPRTGVGHTLREGVVHSLASELGIDPAVAARSGETAKKILGALKDASEAARGTERAQHLARAQRQLARLDPERHGAFVQQAQARMLALQGRGGDTEVAHVTPGEIVIPRALQTPEVMSALSWAAAGLGLSLDRLRVGERSNAVNPQTGAPEFAAPDLDANMGEMTVRTPYVPQIPPGFTPEGSGAHYMHDQSGKLHLTPEWMQKMGQVEIDGLGVAKDLASIAGHMPSRAGSIAADAVGATIDSHQRQKKMEEMASGTPHAPQLPPGFTPEGSGMHFMRDANGKLYVTPEWQKKVDGIEIDKLGVAKDLAMIAGGAAAAMAAPVIAIPAATAAAGIDAYQRQKEAQKKKR